MKRCPDCRRDYYDETLLYCLDDGNALLDGPASVDGPATAILSELPGRAGDPQASENLTRPFINTTAAEAVGPQPSAHRVAMPLVGLGLAVLLVGGFFGYQYFAGAASKQIESIAVMPFANESGSPDTEYLSDGMTETLITSLSQIPNLNVKARSTVFRYKGKETTPQATGRELGVQAVLSGRVTQRGDQVNLSLELVDVATENVIWSKQYARNQSELLSLQTEIAGDVSGRIRSRIGGVQNLAKSSTSNPEAYEAYLRGRFYLNKSFSKADTQRAVDEFQRSISLDSNYANARAGLAEACINYTESLSLTEWESVYKNLYEKATSSARKALELDPELARPHFALAGIHTLEWDFAAAEKEFLKGIEIDPSDFEGQSSYANHLYVVRRFDEAVTRARSAQQADPLSFAQNVTLASALWQARRYDEAIAQFKKLVDMDPNSLVWSPLYFLYLNAGKYEEAIEAGRKLAIVMGRPAEKADADAKLLLATLRDSGAKALIQKHIQLEQANRGADYPQVRHGRMLAFLGKNDEAITMLEKYIATGTKDTYLREINYDPMFEPLRSDSRFIAILAKLGFPPSPQRPAL